MSKRRRARPATVINCECLSTRRYGMVNFILCVHVRSGWWIAHTLSHHCPCYGAICVCPRYKTTDVTIAEIIIKHTRTDTNINTIKMRSRQIQKFQTRRNYMKWINSCVCRSVFGMAAVGEKKNNILAFRSFSRSPFCLSNVCTTQQCKCGN